ncbi:hypothetical protein JCGZ_23607 [Jatropha curcas]|uniref:Cupin type-1 domain-containing protein n=1 Tax=Jatropha curcas TaxID=180498 RepID=A0A067JW71_JATCU|nr:hypothetical protein JCGZ_23607 [Jatropha curcas]
MGIVDRLFVMIFDYLNENCKEELEVVQRQYPFETLKYLRNTLRLRYEEGIQMLKEAGAEIDPYEKLNTVVERKLSQLILEKYGAEFYMLHRCPLAARPFYTMPCYDDAKYSNSFDAFIRGEKIISGAQLSEESAKTCGIDVIFVNGKFCINPNLAEANDFSFSGLNIPRNRNNGVGSNVTLVNVDLLAGLNTLGISLARLDFAPYGGLNPPHIHPRATEILVVLKGTLYVGFVTSNPSRLFAKVLYPGDVFVFPIGLIHFQLNVAKTEAVAFAGLSSQNPGVITIANATFGSDPPINPDVLAKAFQLDKDVVAYLQKLFGGRN